MNKRILSILLVLTMVLGSATVALAAPYDLVHRMDSAKTYSMIRFAKEPAVFKNVVGEIENYLIEAEDGKLYVAEEVNEALEAGAENFEEAVKDLEPVEIEEPSEDLEVVGVSAIKDQEVIKGEATELKFLVNGKEELTGAEFEKKYEGYTVTFKYNKSGLNAKGKVTATTDFKYTVQVTDAEGNNIPEEVIATDFVDVKVVDATKATKVNAVGLVGSDDKEWTAATVAKGDEVKIVATKYENALGQNNEDKEAKVKAPVVLKAVSSDPTVAYYDNEIKVLKAGTVTFTVEFEGVKEKSTIKVTVKDTQEVAGIKATAQKVQANKESQEIKFTLLDKDNEKMRSEATVYYTVTAEKDIEAEKATELTPIANGDAIIKGKFNKGINTVNVYKDADKKDKLGTFTFEAVDVETGLPDQYKLVVAEDAKELDINPDEPVEKLYIIVEAYIDDVKVDIPSTVKYEVKSSNKDVVEFAKFEDGKIEVKAKGKGNATITLYTVEGDMKTPVATYDVEVKNTVKTIDKLTLKDKAELKVNIDNNKEENLKELVINSVNETIEKNHIKSVIPVEANGIIIVKIDDVYGGEEFVFDAMVDITAPTVSNVKVEKAEVDLVGNAITVTVEQEETYKNASVTLSEKVKVTVNGKSITLDKGTYTVTQALMDAFGLAPKTGKELINAGSITVTLEDMAKNETTYTVKFVAAEEAEK